MTREPEGRPDALEQSAARLAVDAVAMMNRARETAGVSQKELAARLGVGESRVSAILNGDGNVRMATLARVFRALGYRVRLDVQPVSPDAPVIPRRTRAVPRQRRAASEKVSWSTSIEFTALPDTVPADWSREEPHVHAGD